MNLFFLKGARAGGEPGIFFLVFVYFLSSSALDHSATAPPNLHELVLERNPNSQSGAWSTSKPNTLSGVQRKSKPTSDTWYPDKQPKSSTLPLDGTHLNLRLGHRSLTNPSKLEREPS